VLTAAQVEHFLRRGFVRVPGCFSAAAAKPWVDAAWARLGADPADTKTWPGPRDFYEGDQNVRIADFAPKAWEAICGLLGGAERIERAEWLSWSNSFVIRFPRRGGSWEPPSTTYPGDWHLDGDREKRFLDSPEIALLAWAIWNDVPERGGGTYLACDSVPRVAEHFARHPEGVAKTEVPLRPIIGLCRDFAQFTGRVGDVVLAMPQMIHTESDNVSDRARFLTARIVALREPLNFARADPREFSVVESAVLAGLGAKRLDFRRAA